MDRATFLPSARSRTGIRRRRRERRGTSPNEASREFFSFSLSPPPPHNICVGPRNYLEISQGSSLLFRIGYVLNCDDALFLWGSNDIWYMHEKFT